MQHTKFQASKPSGSEAEAEDFSIFSMYFYGSNLGPLTILAILDPGTFI